MSQTFMPAIGVISPLGWTPSYSVTLRSPAGSSVTIQGWPVGPDMDLEAFSADHTAWLKTNLAMSASVPFEHVELFEGRAAMMAEISPDEGSDAGRHQVAWCLHDGWAYAATCLSATTTTDPDLLDVVRRTSLPALGPVERLANGAPRDAGHQPPKPRDWDLPRKTWKSTTLASLSRGPRQSQAFTLEEATSLAGFANGAAFPGVDGRIWQTMDRKERNGMLTAARRSLTSRGLVTHDGTQTTFADEIAWVPAAVHHDMLISILRRTDRTTASTVIAGTPQTAVVVEGSEASRGDVLTVTPIPPAEVLAEVADRSVLMARSAASGSAVTLRAVDMDAAWIASRSGSPDLPAASLPLANVVNEATAFVRANVLHRREGGVSGGDIGWIETPNGYWIVDRLDDHTEDRVEVAPISGDELLDRIRELLP